MLEGVHCLCPSCLLPGKCLPKLRHLPGLFFPVRLFPSHVRGTRSLFSFPADARRLLRLSCCLQLFEPSDARAGCFVRCSASYGMSRCICCSALCACSFQLLLIYNVESASSVLAAASMAVGARCLLARGARRLCRVVHSFTDGWTAWWAVTSTMSGVVDG